MDGYTDWTLSYIPQFCLGGAGDIPQFRLGKAGNNKDIKGLLSVDYQIIYQIEINKKYHFRV